jgi:hypothetical protein
MKIACKQQTRQGDGQQRHWGGKKKRPRRSLSRPELSWASTGQPSSSRHRTKDLTTNREGLVDVVTQDSV